MRRDLLRRALSLSMLLAACQGSGNKQKSAVDSTAAPAAPVATWNGPKACDLLSPDEIGKVTSAAYNAGVVTNDYAADSQCRFDRNDDSKSSVMVSLHGRGKIDPYRNVPGTSTVPDLGREAVWNEGNAQLAVAHDSSVFSISFMPPPGRKAWAVALAREALKKLTGTAQ